MAEVGNVGVDAGSGSYDLNPFTENCLHDHRPRARERPRPVAHRLLHLRRKFAEGLALFGDEEEGVVTEAARPAANRR